MVGNRAEMMRSRRVWRAVSRRLLVSSYRLFELVRNQRPFWSVAAVGCREMQAKPWSLGKESWD